MPDKPFQQLSSSAKAETLVALMTPLVKAMAESISMISGAKTPQLVLDYGEIDGERRLVPCRDDLYFIS